MRAIDFQDSIYRSQPAEKVQARAQTAPNADLAHLAAKKLEQDQQKEATVNQTDKSEDKLIGKDKEEREKEKLKKREKKIKEESEKTRKRPPGEGTRLIDIDA